MIDSGGRKWRGVSHLLYLCQHVLCLSFHPSPVRWVWSSPLSLKPHRHQYILHVLITATLFFSCLLTPTRPDRDGRQWRCCQSRITEKRTVLQQRQRWSCRSSGLNGTSHTWDDRMLKGGFVKSGEPSQLVLRSFLVRLGWYFTGEPTKGPKLHKTSPINGELSVNSHCSVGSSWLCPPHSTTPGRSSSFRSFRRTSTQNVSSEEAYNDFTSWRTFNASISLLSRAFQISLVCLWRTRTACAARKGLQQNNWCSAERPSMWEVVHKAKGIITSQHDHILPYDFMMMTSHHRLVAPIRRSNWYSRPSNKQHLFIVLLLLCFHVCVALMDCVNWPAPWD